MFGYIKPAVSELKVRQNELYQGLYCGLCKSIGKTVGQTARLTLSYDAVFLALLLAAIRGDSFRVKPGRCALHPLKKRPVVENCEALRLAAAAGCVLFAYKIEDDCCDERGFRRFGATLLSPESRRIRKKSEKVLPGDLSGLKLAFDRLAEVEKESQKSPSVDLPADCMGEILGILFAACTADPVAADVLWAMGRHMGRWVYLMDAADDFEKDREKGRFNPFLPDGPDPDRLLSALEAELCGMDHYMAALRVVDEDVHAVLRNILYEGLYIGEKQLTDRLRSVCKSEELQNE